MEIWDAGAAGRQSSAAGAGMLAPLVEAPEDDTFFQVCRQSRNLWPSWVERLEDVSGLGLDYDRSGAVVVDEEHLIVELRQAAARLDEPWQLLDRREALSLVPDLGVDQDQALWLPGEHRVDNSRVCRALVTELRRLGVEIRENTPLIRCERTAEGVVAFSSESFGNQAAGRLLLTAGAWSGSISGIPSLPIRPIKGQMVRFSKVSWPFEGCVRGAHCYGVRRQGEHLLLGATVEDVGFDTEVTGRGVHELLQFVERFLPGLANRPMDASWAGLRPGSPDHKPWIGELDDHLWVASGHFRNGILMAPWTGEYVASALLDSAARDSAVSDPAQDLFDPHREPALSACAPGTSPRTQV